MWEVLKEAWTGAEEEDACLAQLGRGSPREGSPMLSWSRERCALHWGPAGRGCAMVIFNTHECPGQYFWQKKAGTT